MGVVIDGCIRDYPHAKELGLGLWLRGVTPNFHTQTNIMPFAVNAPIACGDTLVMPGDMGEHFKVMALTRDVPLPEIGFRGRDLRRLL